MNRVADRLERYVFPMIWFTGLAIVLIMATADKSTAPNSIAPQVAQVRGAVVHVSKDDECQGSGCLLTPDGILFSAKHITDGDPNGQYTVTLDDGKKYKVKYALEDREADISYMLLDLDGREPNLPCAPLAPADSLRVGDYVMVAGSPLGRDNINTFSLGIVSALNRHLDERRGWSIYGRYQWHAMIQTTSPAFPGNSGGAVFDMQGRVVGVLVAGCDATLNYAVPVRQLRASIDAVRQWFTLCRIRPLHDDASATRPEPEYQIDSNEPFDKTGGICR